MGAGPLLLVLPLPSPPSPPQGPSPSHPCTADPNPVSTKSPQTPSGPLVLRATSWLHRCRSTHGLGFMAENSSKSNPQLSK